MKDDPSLDSDMHVSNPESANDENSKDRSNLRELERQREHRGTDGQVKYRHTTGSEREEKMIAP